jgi:hypothetical protein
VVEFERPRYALVALPISVTGAVHSWTLSMEFLTTLQTISLEDEVGILLSPPRHPNFVSAGDTPFRGVFALKVFVATVAGFGQDSMPRSQPHNQPQYQPEPSTHSIHVLTIVSLQSGHAGRVFIHSLPSHSICFPSTSALAVISIYLLVQNV